MQTFTNLPDELQERIMAYVPRPTYNEETIQATKARRQLLLGRMKHAALNKRLYKMAINGYFRHTQLDVLVTTKYIGTYVTTERMRHLSPRVRKLCPSDKIKKNETLMFGNFEADPIFLDNTVKLRVQLSTNDTLTINLLFRALLDSPRLTTLILATGNYDEDGGNALYSHAQDLVKFIVRESKTVLRRETNDEYEYERRFLEAMEES